MVLMLNLTPEMELHLNREAQKKGVSVEAYALEMLQEQISNKEKQTSLVDVLDSWLDEDDAQEQESTGEFLINALDEDRLSERKLFPPEMKGVSW